MSPRDAFAYEPATGRLLWAVSRAARCAVGQEAGSVKTDGRYRTVVLNGKRLYVHRLVWEIVNGPIPDGLCIDHIDGDGLNNRIDNLRVVTLSANQRNRAVNKTSKSGVAGVIPHAGGYSVFCAGKYLTYSKDFFEACCARKSAESREGYLLRKAA